MSYDPATHASEGASRSCVMPSKEPLVSIIIPCYNYVRYVCAAIQSALAQTYTNIEVLVVDDGSTDETRATISQNFGEEVRYHYKENQGLSAARNTGIQMAGGDFIVFLDADDLLHPKMVSTTMNTLSRMGGDWGMIAVREDRIDGNGNNIPHPEGIRDWNDREISTLDLIISSRFSPTVLVRKYCFDAAGAFDTSLKACEDRDMWLRISEKYRIMQIGTICCSVRRHGSNMSSNAHQQCSAIQRVLTKTSKRKPLRGLSRVYWWKAYSFFCYQRGWLYYHRAPGYAVYNFMISMVLWPFHRDRLELGQKHSLFRVRSLLSVVRHGFFKSR